MTEQRDSRSGYYFGWVRGVSGYGEEFNQNFQTLAYRDSPISVKETARNDPPTGLTTSNEADTYIVGDTPTGAWASFSENNLAVYGHTFAGSASLQWIEITALAGMIVLNETTGSMIFYNGTSWVAIAALTPSQVAQVNQAARTFPQIAAGLNAITNDADKVDYNSLQNKPTTITSAQATIIANALATVGTDNTLTGDGTGSSPLSVATPFTTAEKSKLASLNLSLQLPPLGTANQVLTRTASGYTWANPTTTASGLTSVISDASLTGNGTAASPLSVAIPYTAAEQTKLAALDNTRLMPASGSDGQIIFRTMTGYTWGVLRQLPTGGNDGQWLKRTATGYTWENTPVASGGGSVSASDIVTLLEGIAVDDDKLNYSAIDPTGRPPADAINTVNTAVPVVGDGRTNAVTLDADSKTKLGLLSTTQPSFATVANYQSDLQETSTTSFNYVQMPGWFRTWIASNNAPRIDTVVVSDTTITGTGAASSPLSIATPFTTAEKNKLGNIEAGATADQTATEIRALVLANTGQWFPAANISGLPAVTGYTTAVQVRNALQGLSAGSRLSYNDLDDAPTVPANLTDRLVPTGGSANQVLKKASSTSFDMEWADDESGGTGGGGGHTQAQIEEFARDAVGAALTSGDTTGDLSWTTSDPAETMTATIKSGAIDTTELASGVEDRLMPAGGSANQVLTKTSGTDYAAHWVTPTSGGGSTRTDEDIQDVVGAMVAGNSETGIVVSYSDSNGKLNFTVQNPTWSNILARPQTALRWPTFQEVTGSLTAAQIPSLQYSKISNPPTIPDDIEDLDNVEITSVADEQILQYDSSDSKWKNVSLADAGHKLILTMSGTTDSTPVTGRAPPILRPVGNTLTIPGDLAQFSGSRAWTIEGELRATITASTIAAGNFVSFNAVVRNASNRVIGRGTGGPITQAGVPNTQVIAMTFTQIPSGTVRFALEYVYTAAGQTQVVANNISGRLYIAVKDGAIGQGKLATDVQSKLLPSAGAVGTALRINASGNPAWENVPSELNDLTNVAILSPTNGQVLKYDSVTGRWTNQADAVGAGSDDLILSNSGSSLTQSIPTGSTETDINLGSTLTLTSDMVTHIQTGAWTSEVEVRVGLSLPSNTATVIATLNRGGTEIARSTSQSVSDRSNTVYTFRFGSPAIAGAYQLALAVTQDGSSAVTLTIASYANYIYLKPVVAVQRTDAQVQELARDAVGDALHSGSSGHDIAFTRDDANDTIHGDIQAGVIVAGDLDAATRGRLLPDLSGGTTGQIVKRTATGTEWANESGGTSGITVQSITQTAYDALAAKSATTLYVIAS